MEDKRIRELNMLARKAKEFGLTKKEEEIRDNLRNEYRESVKRNFKAQLDMMKKED